MSDSNDLAALLNPESIAIVGASPRAGSWPARIRANLVRFGYPGKIYPVNPRYEHLWEQRCYTNLDELPEKVDNAVFIVAAPLVVDLLKGSEEPRFRTATVLSGGFGEGDDAEGLKRRDFLRGFAREKGIRVCGPNCMGLMSTRSRAVIYPDQRLSGIREGGLAFVSQSGGLLGALSRAIFGRGLGLSHFVSSGNEIETGLADYLDFFLHDPDTRVLAAIVEGIRESARFLAVTREALARGKPVLMLKIGCSPKGIDGARAHTGALAGDDQVFDAACRQNGIVRVQDLDELLNAAELFLRVNRLPAGNRAAFVTFSGGLKVLVADMAHKAGLVLPELGAATTSEIAGMLGVGTSVGNPLDTGWGGLSSQETYLRCVNTMLADPGVDMLAIQEELPQTEARPDKESNLLALASITETSPKPVVVFSMATQGVSDYGRRFKERCQLPFLEEAHNAVQALKHLGLFGEGVRKAGKKQTGSSRPLGPGVRELLTSKRVLNEWESYRVIGEFGLPVAETVFATSLDDAVKAGEQMGYPVVVKLVAPGITHKTELGAVRVNIKNSDEARLACHEIESAFRRANPESAAQGFLVQQMVCGGVETILGAVNDPVFGPAVMFGVGGEFVEVYRDVAFRLAPVTEAEALEMIRDVRGFPLLSGFRGRAPADLETLSRAVVSLSELALAAREFIQSIDVNPFIALDRGGKAVDAVIITRSPQKDR